MSIEQKGPPSVAGPSAADAPVDDDRDYDLLTIRGLDDWLQPADFFAVASWPAPSSDAALRSRAVGLAEDLLRRGHAVPGDLRDGDHVPWSGTHADLMGRIAALWLNAEADPRFEFVWFDLTPAGEAYAHDACGRTLRRE